MVGGGGEWMVRYRKKLWLRQRYQGSECKGFVRVIYDPIDLFVEPVRVLVVGAKTSDC